MRELLAMQLATALRALQAGRIAKAEGQAKADALQRTLRLMDAQ